MSLWCMYGIFSVKSDFLGRTTAQEQGAEIRYGASRFELSCAELQRELCTLCKKNKEI